MTDANVVSAKKRGLRWWQWALLIFFGLGLIGTLTGRQQTVTAERAVGSVPEQGSSEAASTERVFTRPEPPITMAEYTALQTGMTEEQAFAVVGFRCEESSRTDMAGYVTVAYSCMNPGGSNAMLMFQNDALISKAQFGLD